MSDNTTQAVLDIRPVSKNEVTLTPTVQLYKKREAKGQPYLSIEPTEETFDDYVKFVGKKAIVEMLQMNARQNGQEALDAVLALKADPTDEYAGWSHREVQDPETKKTAEQLYYDPATDVDYDKWYEYLLSGVSRQAGVTKAALVEEREELMKELQQLALQLMKNPGVGVRMLEIGEKVQGLDDQIAAKSKVRRSKAEIEAAAKAA